MNLKDDTVAALAARYIVQIGPDTTTGQMIALLSRIAREAYEHGEDAGYCMGVIKQAEVAASAIRELMPERVQA